MTKKSNKHWHMMNGSIGCIPDNNEVHTSKKSAIESALFLFDDVRKGIQTDLIRLGIHYFNDSGQAGADYVEVIQCHDSECLEEDNYI